MYVSYMLLVSCLTGMVHINSFTCNALHAWKSVVAGDIKLVFFLSRMCSSSPPLSPHPPWLSFCPSLASSLLIMSEFLYNNVKYAQCIMWGKSVLFQILCIYRYLWRLWMKGITIFLVYSMCCANISGSNRITFWSFRREDAIGPTSGSISPVGSSRKTSQQCQQSHTAPVTCLDISRDGLMAVTGLFLTCSDTKLPVLTFVNFLNMLFNNAINC